MNVLAITIDQFGLSGRRQDGIKILMLSWLTERCMKLW